MLIVRTDRELEVPHVDAALRAAGHELVLLPDGMSRRRARSHALREADLLLMCYTPITARVIESAPRLKGIVKYGVGIDAIDIEAAKARGIPVVNIPEYAEETVAEGAFALMIALAKKLKPIQRAMDETGWAWPTAQWMGLDLSGKTLGLVGVGRIGAQRRADGGPGLSDACPRLRSARRTPSASRKPASRSAAPTCARCLPNATSSRCTAC